MSVGTLVVGPWVVAFPRGNRVPHALAAALPCVLGMNQRNRGIFLKAVLVLDAWLGTRTTMECANRASS